MLTILGCIVNMIWRGDLYDHLMSMKKISNLIINKILTLSPQIYEANDCYLNLFGFANRVALIASFIAYEKWVLREENRSKSRHVHRN
jgi:hypothetical protein